jgi:mannosyltransferase OCH1-like enzyme
MIPKIIHQIWLSDLTPIPEKYAVFSKGWENLNSDFEYKLWGEEVFEEFGGRDTLFTKYKIPKNEHPAHLSDILRLLLLRKFGGVYADIDIECLKNVGPLLINNLVCHSPNTVNKKDLIRSDFYCSIPNHRILNYIHEDILANLDTSNGPLWKYGDRRIQRAFNKEVTWGATDITLYNNHETKEYLKNHFYGSWLTKDLPISTFSLQEFKQ